MTDSNTTESAAPDAITHLQTLLSAWITEHSKSEVRQHSDAWHSKHKIGGSAIAAIMGKNPYCSLVQLVGERGGILPPPGDIKIWWGTLFERLIKQYFEHDAACTIYGDDLYIEGSHGAAYSPDGLAIMTVGNAPAIVLCEFKCPYSRVPTPGKPPEYYVPQVKMGLAMCELPTVGILAEAVFRRCTWADLGMTPTFDCTLVSKPAPSSAPLAYGFIGFYVDGVTAGPMLQQMRQLIFETMSQPRTPAGADLGATSEQHMSRLLGAFDKKAVSAWYSRQVYGADLAPLSEDATAFTALLSAHPGRVNLGVLPWKLISVTRTVISKELDYLGPWNEKIAETYEIIQECRNPANATRRYGIYNAFITRVTGSKFVDDE